MGFQYVLSVTKSRNILTGTKIIVTIKTVPLMSCIGYIIKAIIMHTHDTEAKQTLGEYPLNLRTKNKTM